MILAPVLLPGLDTFREIARLWAVRYMYNEEDNCETVYGVAWKRLMVPCNCWVPATVLSPNSPADLEKKLRSRCGQPEDQVPEANEGRQSLLGTLGRQW